ncbi:MAG: carbon monoxide dehydrogenase subunit G [Pseudomonadota bacterium]
MKISGENVIPVDQNKVWEGLNDPEVLRQAIPGCESLEKTGDNNFVATVVTRIGPVSVRFEGQVELADLDPPNGYTLKGSGNAGPMGAAKGAARVKLVQMPDGGTKLAYDVDAEMSGKIAQLGSRLIQSTANILAGQFFSKFSSVVAASASPAGAAAVTAPVAAGSGKMKTLLLAGGAIVVIVVAILLLS